MKVFIKQNEQNPPIMTILVTESKAQITTLPTQVNGHLYRNNKTKTSKTIQKKSYRSTFEE